MNIDWNHIITQVVIVLAPLAISAMLFVAGWIIQQIRAVIAEKAEYKDTLIAKAANKVFDSVLFVAQTEGDALKAASADGKLTPEEKAKLAALAFDTCRGEVGKLIGWFVPEIEAWIRKQIEIAVGKIKLMRSGPASLPTNGVQMAKPLPSR
jgi:hypothetical protein